MITQGYNLQCKDSVGGVKSVYIFDYVKYSRKQYSVVRNELITFPSSNIYKFDALKNAEFRENVNVSADGVSFDQSLTMTFSKIGSLYDFAELARKCIFAVVEDNNGLFWMLGIENGLRISEQSKQTGNAKPTLNGYTMTFSGLERKQAPYFASLDIFDGEVGGRTWDSTTITMDSSLITFDET